MPVTNARQITRIVQLSGQAFPAELADRFAELDGDRPEDKAAVRAFGVEVATELCRTLLDEGVPGIHFITMNRSTATREVYANLAGAAPRLHGRGLTAGRRGRAAASARGLAQALALGGVAADHADHRAGWTAPGGAACPWGGRRGRRRSGRAAGRPATACAAGPSTPLRSSRAPKRLVRGRCRGSR